ncbi:hypothetical protein ALP64_201022 [Pseudomonas syringae pv. actinidiae]|nr:hypothetical protein ALP64_201022 [Pseudomonas syringae pv. actinidiae]
MQAFIEGVAVQLCGRGVEDQFGADVAGGEHHGVFEVHHQTGAVFHDAFVEDVVEGFQYVRVGFFDFVEQHHGIGLASHGFGKHSAGAVADVAGRRAFELADGVGFLVFGKVDADQVALAAVQGVGQGVGGFGLANAGRAGQQEHTDRFLWVGQPCAVGLQALGDGVERGFLAHDPLAHALRQGAHGMGFIGEHLAHRNTGPARYHRSDSFTVDLFRHQRIILANGVQTGLQTHQFGGQIIDTSIGLRVAFFDIGLGVHAFAQGEQFAAGFQ